MPAMMLLRASGSLHVPAALGVLLPMGRHGGLDQGAALIALMRRAATDALFWTKWLGRMLSTLPGEEKETAGIDVRLLRDIPGNPGLGVVLLSPAGGGQPFGPAPRFDLVSPAIQGRQV